MKTIVINGTITTVAPLSITMPVAEGQLGNKFKNFPIMARGVDAEGNKQHTGYLPATTLRGFLRRAIVTDQMVLAAINGNHYTLQKAYTDLIGQDAASESKDDLDLIKLRQTREENAILDMFGSGLGIKSRLLVSHFMPTYNLLPEVLTGVRKDLGDTDGVLDLLSSPDRDTYLGRSDANKKRAVALSVVKGLERDVRKAKKEGKDIGELEAAVKEAQSVVDRYESDMGDMTNSSRTLTSYFALPAGIELKGRLVIENARDRDLPMIELALNELSKRPILGAQSARGCGEIEGKFDVLVDGLMIKTIAIGGWQAATIADIAVADSEKAAA